MMGKADQQAQEDPASRRTFVTLPLAQLVPQLTKPAFKMRSPAGAALMADWSGIVGLHLAALTEPRRLSRGQLTIACAGSTALELQHLQSALIDRINAHAGQRIVEKLRFTQDHIALRPAAVTHKFSVSEERVTGLDGPLADALSALLGAIRQRSR